MQARYVVAACLVLTLATAIASVVFGAPVTFLLHVSGFSLSCGQSRLYCENERQICTAGDAQSFGAAAL
jgi:hypothetical protein